MFHWICPECGREIPPSVKECVACDPKARLAPVEIAVRPATSREPEKVPERVAERIPEALPDPLLALAEMIRTAQGAGQNNLLRQESKAEPVPEPQPEQPPAEPLTAVAVMEAEPVPVVTAPVFAALDRPAAEAPQPQSETSATAVAVLDAEPVSVPAPVLTEMIRTARAAVRQESNSEPVAEPHSEPAAESAEAVSQSVAELAAAVGVLEPEPVPEPVAEPAPRISITQFFPVTQAIALLAAPEVETVAPAPLAAAAEIELAPAAVKPAADPAPQPVEQPRLAPLTQLATDERLPSGSWLKMAPLQDYTAAASESMRPAAPPQEILVAQAGPKMTLPGPALPPSLVSLKNAGVVTVIGGPKPPRKLPGWLVSGMLMMGIPLAGGVLLLYFQPQHSAAEAKAPAAAVAAVSDPAPVTHSLADYVEVTGFRIVVDFNKKSEIHYLVVNHSGAELSDMTIYVTLHAADAQSGQPPLCRFSFRAPGLGPFESKEMTSPIEKLTRAVVLPEWQNLRADVQIGQ